LSHSLKHFLPFNKSVVLLVQSNLGLDWYDFLSAVNVSATQRSKSIECICFIYVDLQDVFLLYLQRGNERIF